MNVWNVIEIECQPGTFPVHVAFKCHFAAVSCNLFFLDLVRGASLRVLFLFYLKSVKSDIVVRPICSSLISLKRGVRALFLLGTGFKIIIFFVPQSWHFYHCVYIHKEKLLIFCLACVQNFTAAASCRALWFAYEISAQFCHSYTPEPLCSPRNKSSAL